MSDHIEAALAELLALDRRETMFIDSSSSGYFDERGLNVVAHASTIDSAWLADPPSGGVAILESAGVAVHKV